jgi:EAL domain-containing protein (putative c-di-GMP-specific phosphodiesterase class I)
MSERSALDTILRPGGITTLLQPMVRRAADGSIALHGLECLSRGPKGTNFEATPVLFDYVRLKGEETLVDRACISAAFQHAATLASDVNLAVNVHASTLGRDSAFLNFLRGSADKHRIAMSRLTIEIVEHAPMWDSSRLLSTLTALRETGAKIALDDVGLGQSNFKMLIDVAPDYLKLDRWFVDGCGSDPKRQAVIHAILDLAREFGAEVIAEGVEKVETADALQELGITLMQGFLFGAPAPQFSAPPRSVPAPAASPRTEPRPPAS